MQYLKSLENLGLNQHEQEVYFALLQLEKATANEIARKSGVKRPTTYDILYRLAKDGFIAQTEENEKMMFVAVEPQKLPFFLEEKKRELERDLPLLTSIYNTKAKKPKVAYFEGLDGIKQLYADIINSLSKSDEVLAYVIDETVEALGKELVDLGVKKRIEKGIKLRAIYQKSAGSRGLMKDDPAELRAVRISHARLPLKNEVNIYADKVVMATYKPEPFGVLIESKEIADTQRAIFEMAWRGAGRYQK